MQFIAAAAATETFEVSMTPIRVEANGITSTERKVNVIERGISTAASLALSGTKGKIGTMIRGAQIATGLNAIAASAARGQFRPFAEVAAFTLGRTITMANAKDWDSFGYHIDQCLESVLAKKNGGYSTSGKPTSEHSALLSIKGLYKECDDARIEQRAADAARRAAVSA
jgi:hypothetical protein